MLDNCFICKHRTKIIEDGHKAKVKFRCSMFCNISKVPTEGCECFEIDEDNIKIEELISNIKNILKLVISSGKLVDMSKQGEELFNLLFMGEEVE